MVVGEIFEDDGDFVAVVADLYVAEFGAGGWEDGYGVGRGSGAHVGVWEGGLERGD